MKRQAEKADIVKRKVFHEHIILLTEGRFLMLAVLAVMVWLPYLFVRDRMAGTMLAWWEIPFLLLVEVSLYYALLRQFWYRCFGCLVVTEDEIVWKCPFMRTVRLCFYNLFLSGCSAHSIDNGFCIGFPVRCSQTRKCRNQICSIVFVCLL